VSEPDASSPLRWDPALELVAEQYAASRARVVDLVADLPAAAAARQVPGCPKWSVHDVLAHLSGAVANARAGDLDGAPGDEWTARQIDPRRGATMSELLAELRAHADWMDAGLRAGAAPRQAVLDIVTHEQDIRGALGAEPVPDPLAIRLCAEGFAAGQLTAIHEAGLPEVRLADPDDDWSFGAGTPAVTCRASVFELARAMAGRRSERQVMGYDWSADPSPYLSLLCPFGPLPTVDVTD
jgi:uncharacterized protein (TIGR03083 family)